MTLSVASRQTRREREIQQQMESRDEETLELKETYSSLQQEVDIKTKKLKKVRGHILFPKNHDWILTANETMG